MPAPTKVELSITTSSQKMLTDPMPKPILPTITMNGASFPPPSNTSALPSGWQFVVISAFKDMTNPANIISNKCISLTTKDYTWSSNYQFMYRGMVNQALNSGNVQQQLVIAVSYGLDRNMPPTNDGLELLLEYGAGTQLQGWETSCNPGSQGGGTKQLVAMPVNYILVGYSSDSYGTGTEKFEHGDPVKSNLTVTLSNPPGD
jgi:hypothetical protein